MHNITQQRADKFVGHENLLDTIFCDEREERERRNQNPVHPQENLDLRDALPDFVARVKQINNLRDNSFLLGSAHCS